MSELIIFISCFLAGCVTSLIYIKIKKKLHIKKSMKDFNILMEKSEIDVDKKKIIL